MNGGAIAFIGSFANFWIRRDLIEKLALCRVSHRLVNFNGSSVLVTNCVAASFTFGCCRIEAINKRNDVSCCRLDESWKWKVEEQVSFSSFLPLFLFSASSPRRFHFFIVSPPAFINLLRRVALFFRENRPPPPPTTSSQFRFVNLISSIFLDYRNPLVLFFDTQLANSDGSSKLKFPLKIENCFQIKVTLWGRYELASVQLQLTRIFRMTERSKIPKFVPPTYISIPYTFVEFYSRHFLPQPFFAFHATRIFHPSRTSWVFRRKMFQWNFLGPPSFSKIGTNFPSII